MDAETKPILLIQWGASRFDPAPSLHTLVGMARKGQILPPPQKRSGLWYVHPTAEMRKQPGNEIRRSAALPGRTELYRHFDAAGRLLYAGISLSTAGRLGQHRLGSKWSDQVATITIQRFDTRAEALAAEREAIRNEKPLYNIKEVG